MPCRGEQGTTFLDFNDHGTQGLPGQRPVAEDNHAALCVPFVADSAAHSLQRYDRQASTVARIPGRGKNFASGTSRPSAEYITVCLYLPAECQSRALEIDVVAERKLLTLGAV